MLDLRVLVRVACSMHCWRLRPVARRLHACSLAVALRQVCSRFLVTVALIARPCSLLQAVAVASVLLAFLLLPDLAYATSANNQGPWAAVGAALCKLFFSTLGKALAIVAVVIGGLMYAFGEGGSKSQIAGLAFGAGMVLMAPDFLTWILGSTDKLACPTVTTTSTG